MKSIPQIIYYLIFFGIILNAINTYIYQNNLELIENESVVMWNSKLTFIGYMLISLASILSFSLYRKYFPNYISFCYVSLIVLVLIASRNDLGEIMKTPSFFYSIKGVGTFVNFGLLFFVANTQYFQKILKIFYYLCFIFIIAGFINLKKVGFGAGREQNLYAIREFAVYLIWVFPYFLLQDNPIKKINFLNAVAFLLIFLFILFTGSRSYLIIYFIYFLFKFKNQLSGKNGLMTIVATIGLIAVGYFLLTNTGFNKTVEGAFNILSERKSDDSRSSELMDFMGQWDLNYLIQGVGPNKTWYRYGIGYYSYLDNQFILLAWWAGLPTLLVYFFFLIRSFFNKSDLLLVSNTKGVRLTIGLWILACMGFAVYASVNSGLYYYFITFLIGLYTCKFTTIYNSDVEEA